MQPPASELLALRARETTYPGTAEHVSTVRADLRLLLHDCPIADDVILCASELAANAATHSRSCLPGGTFTVRILISRGDFVRIEVLDNGGQWTPAATDTTGRHGLDIVRALADKWGTDGSRITRTTWAIFNWPHGSQTGGDLRAPNQARTAAATRSAPHPARGVPAVTPTPLA